MNETLALLALFAVAGLGAAAKLKWEKTPAKKPLITGDSIVDMLLAPFH